MKKLKLNSPLEGQVQVDEEDTKPVSNLVGCADILGGHGSETRGGDDNTHETRHEHAAAGVDLVVEPSAQRVVDQTCTDQRAPFSLSGAPSYRQLSARRHSRAKAYCPSRRDLCKAERHSCSNNVSANSHR